jgi:type IV pilus assembly protein PilV
MKGSSSAAGGFTIVEVLVALVVLAVGMLGIAGLYVITLGSGGAAINRMQAVNLATDIADRIRSNRNANVAYAGGASAGFTCIGDGAVNCTAAEMAADDLLQWNDEITAVLPSASGTIAVAGSSAPYAYTITISWSEPGQTAAQTYVMNMQL